MTSIDSFVAQQNASGRGANGIGLDYSAVGVAQAGVNLGTVSVPSGQNAVIGFQSAAFTSGVDTVVLDGPRSSYVIQVAADGDHHHQGCRGRRRHRRQDRHRHRGKLYRFQRGQSGGLDGDGVGGADLSQ